MELLKDYDCDICYYPGKVNRVTDALSRKSSIAHMLVKEWTLVEEVRDSKFKFEVSQVSSLLAMLKIELNIHTKIKAKQFMDQEI